MVSLFPRNSKTKHVTAQRHKSYRTAWTRHYFLILERPPTETLPKYKELKTVFYHTPPRQVYPLCMHMHALFYTEIHIICTQNIWMFHGQTITPYPVPPKSEDKKQETWESRSDTIYGNTQQWVLLFHFEKINNSIHLDIIYFHFQIKHFTGHQLTSPFHISLNKILFQNNKK